MGDCRYCGKSAGFLRKEHKACAASHERGLESIRKVCVDAALYGVDVDRLTDRVRSIGASSFIDTSGAAMTATLAEGWGQAVKAAMDDHARHGEGEAGGIQDGRDRCLVFGQHYRRGDEYGQRQAAQGG